MDSEEEFFSFEIIDEYQIGNIDLDEPPLQQSDPIEPRNSVEPVQPVLPVKPSSSRSSIITSTPAVDRTISRSDEVQFYKKK